MPSAHVVAEQVSGIVWCLRRLGPPAPYCWCGGIPVLGIPGLHAPCIIEVALYFGWCPPAFKSYAA